MVSLHNPGDHIELSYIVVIPLTILSISSIIMGGVFMSRHDANERAAEARVCKKDL